MIFLGYNYLGDRYCWQPTPTALENINNITIQNGIYDYFNVTKDTDFDYITTYPDVWDIYTIMDADFNGNINAGNIDYIISEISAISVKRRKKGDFNWYTLYNIPINDASDIDFVRYDYLGQNETEYEYALVPIIGNVEGEYFVNSIESKFYSVFLTDGETSYKFRENVSYSGNERVHPTATYEPFGSKYPIVVSNGNLSYDTGTVSGDIIIMDNDILDRKSIVERLDKIKDFLNTSSAKILKDFNGNIWLVTITDNAAVTYYAEVGMGFAQVSFNWAEIGDADSGEDLYNNNLIYSAN